MKCPDRPALVIGGLCLGVFALGGAWVGGPAVAPRAWQVFFAVGCAGHLLLLWTFRRRGIRPVPLFLAAALLRVPLLATPPDIDCYRYMWEGRIQQRGFNPFAVSPADPTLIPLRDAIWPRVDKKQYATIYPPLAQAYFNGLARASYRVKTAQFGACLLDLAVVLLLLDTLRALRRPAWFAAIYALCPLVLASFAQAGHCDALMLIPLLLFVRLAHQRRWRAAGVALAAAVLAKTVPVILLAALWRRGRTAVAVAAVLIVAGYLPFAAAGFGLFKTLISFPQQDRFNSPAAMLGRMGAPMIATTAAGVALIAAAAAWTAFAGRRRGSSGNQTPRAPRTIEADARGLMTVALLALPIIHFWYLTWVLVLVALRPTGGVKWLVLSVTLLLYWNAAQSHLAGGAWQLSSVDMAIIWTPFVLAWLVEHGVRTTSRRADSR